MRPSIVCATALVLAGCGSSVVVDGPTAGTGGQSPGTGGAPTASGGGTTTSSMGPGGSGAGGSGPAPTPRILYLYTAHGVDADAWEVTGGAGSGFSWSEVLQPLAVVEDYVTPIRGLELPVTEPMSPHDAGAATVLTGRMGSSAGETLYGVFDPHWGGGRSIDRLIADTMPTPLSMVGLGVVAEADDHPYHGVSYLGLNEPNPVEDDPSAAFQAVTSTLPPSPALFDLAGRIAEVQADLLDDPDLSLHVLELLQVQLDLVLMAMRNDITRVGLVQLAHLTSSVDMAPFGYGDDYFLAFHDGSPQALDAMTAFQQEIATKIANLALAMQAIPEGDGTMLDHTLIVWLSEMGHGPAHSRKNLPVVLVGNLGGQIDAGRVHDHVGTMVDLHITLGQLFGADLTGFGDPALDAGPMLDLVR